MADELDSAYAQARTTGELYLSGQAFEVVPDRVRELTGLRKLHLVGCFIKEVPGWIAELTSLQVLDLGNNPLDRLPPELAELPVLRELELSLVGNAVHAAVLARLTSLEALSLAWNNIHAVPSWVGGLSRLRLLDLGGNPVESLPDELAGLRRLTHLYLGGHRFHQVPEVLGALRNLEVLDLSAQTDYRMVPVRSEVPSRPDDQAHRMPKAIFSSHRTARSGGLRHLPDWLAESFPALRELYVGGQHVRALPSALPEGLRGIYLAGNEFEELPPALADLPALREVDLRGNRLHDLPVDVERLRDLAYLDLAGNPLSVPPEILAERSRPAAILDYISRTSGSTRRLDEAKLLVVGEPAVGKTSLIKRLVSGGFSEDERKTEGIDVIEWGVGIDGDRIRVNVWDFGGQEIMHATHQFFLTKRSVYVLVIDARQDEDQNRIEYWLKLVQSFSGHSPVIIVGNKTDQSVLDIDMRGLRNKYPDIIDIRSVSCKTGDGIAEMQELLAASIRRLPHVRDPLPEAFFEVKGELEQFDMNFLPYRDYVALCRRHGVVVETSQELLVGFLHDLGTVVCFRDDPRLADTNILNPRWVTGGVYRLLNSYVAAQKKGLLRWDDVDTILSTDDYPPERRAFIVDMMKKFELCYESDGTFLVPDLLTKEEPDTGPWEDALRFEVSYDVLPSSIVSRLIVRMHTFISRGTVWRTGLVLSMDGNRALVKGDREDGVIRIAVSGPATGRRGLLTAIRSALRSIEQTIPGLVGDERVPVPGHPGIWVPYRHLVDLEAAGRREVVPQGLTDDFDIRELLAGVEDPARPVAVPSSTAVLPGRTARTGRGVPDAAPADRTAGAVPGMWTPPEALLLGGFLLAALVVLVLTFVVADRFVGTAAAAGVTAAAVPAVAMIGGFVLRSSGRLSEDGLVATLQRARRQA